MSSAVSGTVLKDGKESIRRVLDFFYILFFKASSPR